VLPEPGERYRIVWAKSEYLVRHWDESVQIEWARLAHSYTGDSALVATADGFAELSGQQTRSSHAQRARLRGRWRHQQVEDILLQAVEVDLPGDDSRACGSASEGSELIARSNHGETVVQPIGMRQPHRCGLTFGFGALGRTRCTGILVSGWRSCRHINRARC
jgi:hypothetical protein